MSTPPFDCTRGFTTAEAELRDHEALPRLLEANTLKSMFANMMLYVRYQVEEFTWKKWGSPEALYVEYESDGDKEDQEPEVRGEPQGPPQAHTGKCTAVTNSIDVFVPLTCELSF